MQAEEFSNNSKFVGPEDNDDVGAERELPDTKTELDNPFPIQADSVMKRFLESESDADDESDAD